jgi:hypothetical protein
MKVLVVLVTVALLFFAADGAYALGGGGHHGDGRSTDMTSAGHSDGATSQNAPNGGTHSIPEPTSLLLLGLGVVGLAVMSVAGIRRKFKK